MGRKPVEVELTKENIGTALVLGDIIEGDEELGVVVSARMDVRGQDAVVYFMGGDCYREALGIPSTLTVLRDPGGPEFEWTGRPIGTHVMAEISKAGGGTVGRRYQGLWSYRLTQNGKVVAEGDDLRTDTPKTHHEAAVLAWGSVDEQYAAEH
jgi:hypothetical protein